MDRFTDRAIRLEPGDPDAWHMRTDPLALLKRWHAALQANDMRIKLVPSDPNSYVARAQVRIWMGRPDEALKLIERVFAMNPPNRGSAAAKDELLRIAPGYTISQLHAKRYSDHPDYQKLAEKFWYEGLRMAGIPEQ